MKNKKGGVQKRRRTTGEGCKASEGMDKDKVLSCACP